MEKITIDAALLNTHLKAAAKDKTRPTLYNTLRLERRGNTLHVKSTDGRVMLHTAIDGGKCGLADGGGDWECIVHIPSGKIAAKKGEVAVLEVDGGKSVKVTTAVATQIYQCVDDRYPDTEQVEAYVEKEPAKDFKAFAPCILQIVWDYLENDKMAYCHPVGAEGFAPCMWRKLADGVEKIAVAAPLRCE